MVPQNEAIVARASTTWLAKNDLTEPVQATNKPKCKTARSRGRTLAYGA